MFLLFYSIASGLAIESIANMWPQNLWYGVVGYSVGGLWFVGVCISHWHACTTTD